jgi:hypothetical protein
MLLKQTTASRSGQWFGLVVHLNVGDPISSTQRVQIVARQNIEYIRGSARRSEPGPSNATASINGEVIYG